MWSVDDEALLWTAVLLACVVLFAPCTSADALVPRRELGVYEDATRINHALHTRVGRRELAYCMVKTFATQSLVLFLPSRVHRVVLFATWFVSSSACHPNGNLDYMSSQWPA